MSFLLQLLGEFFLSFFLSFFWWLIPDEIERRRDRKLLARGEVRCWLRAVEGRVLNIGTEFSVGTAVLDRGMLHFTPTVGIVGDRRIVVTEILESPSTPWKQSIGSIVLGPTIVVATTGGELFVQFPHEVAADAIAILEVGREPDDAPTAD